MMNTESSKAVMTLRRVHNCYLHQPPKLSCARAPLGGGRQRTLPSSVSDRCCHQPCPIASGRDPAASYTVHSRALRSPHLQITNNQETSNEIDDEVHRKIAEGIGHGCCKRWHKNPSLQSNAVQDDEGEQRMKRKEAKKFYSGCYYGGTTSLIGPSML